MADNIVRIMSEPGIKRDGTRFEGNTYVDGVWCRFQRGLPRKIWGYRSINKYLTGLVRAIDEYTLNGLSYVHAGSSALLERFYIDNNGNTSLVSNRTPSALTASTSNMWQFANNHDTTGALLLLAQVAPNLTNISNNSGGQLFYGSLTGTSTLTQLTVGGTELPTGVSLTGGVVALSPYTFIFGDAGYVAWSVAGNPKNYVSTGSGSANITAQKIVAALPLRGGPGSAPSGLFWSLDSLLRVSFVGGTTIFQFDTLSSQTSILSSNCVIEYDGIFYWAGVDRFLMFNGVVREIPNVLNQNFFFDNLNWDQRQKVFVTKVPRFGEIWWCFPKGTSTEPNWAVIYNIRDNTWYDTPLPESGRSAGTYSAVIRKPLMAGVDLRNYIATTLAISAAGTGYSAGNVLTATGGNTLVPVQATVTTVGGGGAITAVALTNAGTCITPPSSPVTMTGGGGTGATLTITYVQPYSFWVHETGLNAVDGVSEVPIQSYFETADISLPVEKQINKALQVLMLEPDFVQSGDMTVQVKGRANARSPEVDGDIMTFPDTPSTPQEQVVYFKAQRRELRFKFESNVIDGDYQMGMILAHVQPADGTVIG